MVMKSVLIFKDNILPASETFILSQGEGLTTFKAFYVGARKVDGIAVPAGRSLFINDGGRFGRFREILFKAFDHVSAKQLATLRRIGASLIHAHFGPDGVLAQPLAKALQLPLVVTFHGYDATTHDDFASRSFFKHRKYLRRRGRLIESAAKFIAVSEFVKRKIMAQGFPEEKIVVLYTGIDLEAFRPSAQVLRKPMVLFVGRLVSVKGCSYLIRAMQRVQESFPEVELVIIGDGPLRSQLEQEARASLNHYRFLGVQPPQVVREWLNQAKVFSVPSITEESGAAEGFGMVFAEAQAMGVPVVSSLSGGIPEAVAHGETGLLAAERDVEGLAAHILRLLTDENLWSLMSAQGQKRVADRFDLRRQTVLLDEIYREVCGW